MELNPVPIEAERALLNDLDRYIDRMQSMNKTPFNLHLKRHQYEYLEKVLTRKSENPDVNADIQLKRNVLTGGLYYRDIHVHMIGD